MLIAIWVDYQVASRKVFEFVKGRFPTICIEVADSSVNCSIYVSEVLAAAYGPGRANPFPALVSGTAR